MSSPTDLTARVHIVLEIDRPGPEMEQLAEGVQKVNVRIAEINQVQNTYKQTTISTTASVRHLLLNLRMFSFGIRTLRREFGDTSPALEAFSTGLITIAAIGSTLVSASSLIKGAIGRLKPLFQAGSKEALKLAADMAALGITWTGVAVAAALLIAIPVSSWLLDAFTGVHELRQEAKSLALDLKMLETRLKSLSAEQEKFNVGMSATQIQMRELKRAIDLAGGSNAALEAQLAVISAEYENMSIVSMKARLEQEALTIAQTEGKTAADDLARAASARKQARSRIGGFIGEETIAEALKLQGITEGRPSMESLRAAAGGEQSLGGLSIAGAPQVTITFPGAVFNTEGDITGALEDGGTQAARILYNQYTPPGGQR